MRIHTLLCGAGCPRAAGLLVPPLARFVCRVWLLETRAGLALVDTGFGAGDARDPRRLGPSRWLLRPALDAHQTAVAEVRRRGGRPEDVRDILLTHLDLDHAGGLGDFPHANVHVLADEHARAVARRTGAERRRYRPAQWAHGPRWVLHRRGAGETWNGLDGVRSLETLSPDLLLVPTVGHTHGHAAYAARTPGGWRIHAGDALYTDRELGGVPLGLGHRVFLRVAHELPAQAAHAVAALRQLHDSGAARITCSHAVEDPLPGVAAGERARSSAHGRDDTSAA